MRKVVSSLFISLDGVVENPENWSFDHFDEGMMVEMNTQLEAANSILLGRVTYEEWAEYWPNSDDEPFASYINNISKYVASSTLDKVTWQNTTLLKGDLKDAIAKLKNESGKNISVSGSPTLVRNMLFEGLIDQLTLTIYPVIVGSGTRLFNTNEELKRMKLVSSKSTETGVVICNYQPR